MRESVSQPFRWGRLVLSLLIWFVASAAAFLALAIRNINRDLPASLETLLRYKADEKSVLFSADGVDLAEYFFEDRAYLALERMPAHVPAAFVSAEDRRFFRHEGFDPIGIARAAFAQLRHVGIPQGGSTITQQLIKQTLLADAEKLSAAELDLPAPERAALASYKRWRRKLAEIVLAVRVENELTKSAILEAYLNHVFLGKGYGVRAAARAYFAKEPNQLTIAEAALLAALVPAPSATALHKDLATAQRRQRDVLRRMLEDGYITPTEFAQAVREATVIVSSPPHNDVIAPAFAERVRVLATQQFGQEHLFRGGLTLFGTLDLALQQVAQEAVARGVNNLRQRHGFAGPIGSVPRRDWATWRKRSKPLEDPREPARAVAAMVITRASNRTVVGLDGVELRLAAGDEIAIQSYEVREARRLRSGDLVLVEEIDEAKHTARLTRRAPINGALVVLDYQGRVRAMVGGVDGDQFNRATQARRQLGSAIKPFIYSEALQRGASQFDRVVDQPVHVKTASGSWSPTNYSGTYAGAMTLRTALAKSVNTVAVRLAQSVGIDAIIRTMQKLGFASPLVRHISLALGTVDVTLLEATLAYAALARGGRPIEARYLDRVTANGNLLFEPAEAEVQSVIEPSVAYVVTDMMRAVVENGTAQRARSLGRPAAGKTGTSADYRDAWFVGYTAELICGVWLGRDDSRPIGDGVTGGSTAVPIWTEVMDAAHRTLPIREFAVPAGVGFVRADGHTGRLNDAAPWRALRVGQWPQSFGPLPKQRPTKPTTTRRLLAN